jgi:membrane-associated phospholipid phosphatase
VTLAAAFAVFWVVVYGGTSWLTSLHGWRVQVHREWELALPFVAWMAPVYLSLLPMMLLSLGVFRRWLDLVPLLIVLVVQTLVAVPFFLLLPVELAFARPAPEGVLGGLFRVADFLNLEDNYLPSLHVCFAFTTAWAIGLRLGPRIAAALMLWASAIAVSTLLLHQHHFLDVVAALILTAATMGILYRRVSRPAFLRALRAEVICLAEIYHFSRRHLRYLLIAVLVWGRSLPSWRDLRPIRIGFCYLQHIDDLLDGHRPCAVEPTERVDAALEQFISGSFDETWLGCLGRCLWEVAARFERGDDDPRGEIVMLIRRMRRDRVRVRESLVLPEDELRAHHRATFHLAVNLMLMLGGGELRARHAPDLIEAFGWCSTMRDLEDDLEQGLVNLPLAIVEAARREGARALDYETLVASPAAGRWMRREYDRAVGHLDRFEEELPNLRGRRGESVLRLFHRSIRRFADKEAKRRGWNRASSSPESGDQSRTTGVTGSSR